MDATAGYSIYGSLAFLNANKLRPNLQEIEEFELPERATSAMLKNSKDAMKAKFPKDEERISESDRILNAVRESEKNQEPVSLTNVKFQTKQLQNELAEEFLDRLSYQIGKYWKSEYSEVAKNVVFADKQLIIRQVIFLITN
jgi:bisphosphoglycerate-dependent phosphoglycerate mutase